MGIKRWVLALCLVSFGTGIHANTEEKIFPDVGGILDFSKPKEISDRIFVLTNPKSGSHLLLYSLMKVTGRPMRGRLDLYYFLHKPDCFEPENMMDYPLDFTKPTTYWGHEYRILRTLNDNRNKLIFITRDYKENLVSQIVLSRRLCPPEDHIEEIEQALFEEVFGMGPVFFDIIGRLMTFDQWDPRYRHLVHFKDLVSNPRGFLPGVLAFIGEDSPCEEFIEQYAEFKKEHLQKYRQKNNSTGSGEKPRYFRQFISSRLLRLIDTYMQQTYPLLWERYLKEYQEI